MKDRKWSDETLAVHAGARPDTATGARAVPIYQTTSYVFKDTKEAAELFALEREGNIYSRLANPTVDVFEKRVAALEGGSKAIAVSSGQAAIALTILNLASTGDEIISSASLYGGTHTLFNYTLKRAGIKVIFVDSTCPENFRKAYTKKTKAFYAETIGNPKLDAVDFEKISVIAREKKVPLVIDNTIATPFLVNPIRYGADIVVHSATKYIGGNGTSIGGVIVDSGNFDWQAADFIQFTEPDKSYHGIKFIEKFGKNAFTAKLRLNLLRDLGACMSPFNAFLFLIGLETLHLRMPCHSENAMKVAEFLQRHKKVAWVNYPGLKDHPQHAIAAKYFKNGWYSGVIGFGIKGGLKAGTKFIDSLKLVSHAANIGDAKSLVLSPAATTHQQLSQKEREACGVTEDFIRLSIGIENVKDIIADIDQALEG